MNDLSHHLSHMAIETERRLIDDFAATIFAAVGVYVGRNPQPKFVLEAFDLEEVIGKKYAYLVMRRCRFRLIGGEWVRPAPFGDDVVELYAEDLAPALRAARKALDPLKLLAPYMAGAL